MSAMSIDSRTLQEHASYIRDAVRLEKFEAAILESVGEGDVVLDLGARTSDSPEGPLPRSCLTRWGGVA